MPHHEKKIITPATIEEMVNLYNAAIAQAEAAYKELEAAEIALKTAFGTQYRSDFSLLSSKGNYIYGTPKEHFLKVKTDIKRRAWQKIIGMMELRKFLPTERIDKMDKDIEEDKTDDISIIAILELFSMVNQNGTKLRDEIIMEAYDAMRPRRDTHKTNSQFEVGKRVILVNRIDYGFSTWRANHHYRNELAMIDKAFHVLDGAGLPGGYKSPLVDAIETTTHEYQTGETDYFKFKLHLNGNLHLEMLRPDLVQAFNQIAGAGMLHN